jgi:hypothetical protein
MRGMRLRRSRSIPAPVFALLIALASASVWMAAQAPARKALTVEDYTKWRTIAVSEISGDGSAGAARTNPVRPVFV